MTAILDKYNVIHISPELLKKLKDFAENHSYTVDSDLYYENQIPIVGYLIVKGSGKLFKKRRKEIPLKPGDLVGLIELFSHRPSVYGAKIEAESEVVFLDLSTLKEIMNAEIDEDLKKIFEELLEHA